MNKMHSAAEGKPFFTARTMSLIGLMTALTCVLGPLAIPLPFSPVPISLTNLAVYLAVYVLGMKAGTVSYLVYLLLGMAGLPVFSGFTGGIGKLAGPTGGYLIGFIFMAVIAGFAIEYFPGKKLVHAAGLILGTGVCYLFGTVWLAHQLGISFTAALASGVIPYLPGDTVKILFALVIGSRLRREISLLSQRSSR